MAPARHWARVKHFGLRVGGLRGANLGVVELFAFLRDSRREDIWTDPHHGVRGAEFARHLNGRFFSLAPTALDTLCAAIRDHGMGRMEREVTIQTCWDADCLDLSLVGITLRADLQSDEAERMIAEATHR